MKKFLAVMLAVVTALSVCAVYAAADVDYMPQNYSAATLSGNNGNGKIASNHTGDVLIFKPGDTITWPAYTGTSTAATLTVTLYPDAVNVPSIQNVSWNAYVNSLKPIAKFASSQGKYKNFKETRQLYTAGDTENNGQPIVFTVPALNDVAFAAYDSGNNLMATVPIDYALTNDDGSSAEFLGWALYSPVASPAANTTTARTLVLYAYWSRNIPVPTEPTSPTEPETEPETEPTTLTPIMSLRDYIRSFFSGGGSGVIQDIFQRFIIDKEEFNADAIPVFLPLIPNLFVNLYDLLGLALTAPFLNLFGIIYDFLGIS